MMKETEWKEARGREEEAWRLEPEAETEMPETGALRTGLKASTWTLMVKATRNEGKSKITEVKEACQQKMANNLRARR